MPARLHTRLTGESLSVQDAHAFVADAAAGASVVFTGSARNHADGRAVTGLDYEAYEEQASAQIAWLAQAVGEKWPGALAIWMEHRVGTLAIGEPSVVVAVSAAHRVDAFDAARFGIDELKATVAIWKKEHWADGATHWPGTD